MRTTVTTLALICTLKVFGQTSQEHLQNGITRHKKLDYTGAIKDYSNAIKEDPANKDAYFNRGTCELALKDFKSAMVDFTKTIELDPTYAIAYYSRASVFVSQGKYAEALPDLDKTVELDPKTPNALTLRGQIRTQTGNKKGACEDFSQAKQVGDPQADTYLTQFCGNELQAGESLAFHWPENENWKIGTSQETQQMAMIELIHSNETLENWTEMGTMMSVKGARNVPMDEAMESMYAQTKQNSPKAKLTFIEKDETAEYPWIIFTIESPGFKNDKTPESQLWYIVQGKDALYVSFRAVKQATVPPELKEKWIAFFKAGEIVRK